MARALTLGVFLLAVLLLMYVVVPIIITEWRERRSRRPSVGPGDRLVGSGDRLVRPRSKTQPEHEDLDGPDGPHNRPTV